MTGGVGVGQLASQQNLADADLVPAPAFSGLVTLTVTPQRQATWLDTPATTTSGL